MSKAMFAKHPDSRSPEVRALDEQIAQSAQLPPLDVPPSAVAAPFEAHLPTTQAPVPVSGETENANASTTSATRQAHLALYWRVCGFLSIAWIAMGFLVIAARVYIGPKIAEPIGPLTLKLALWLNESGILFPLAAMVTVPGAIAFFRRSRGRSFRLWFGCYSLLIIAFNLLCVALLGVASK